MSLKYEVIRTYKTLRYFRHTNRHRLDGPADIRESTSMYWFQYGVSHRNDGPSDQCYIPYKLEYATSYFIRGKFYTRLEYESKIRNKIYQ